MAAWQKNQSDQLEQLLKFVFLFGGSKLLVWAWAGTLHLQECLQLFYWDLVAAIIFGAVSTQLPQTFLQKIWYGVTAVVVWVSLPVLHEFSTPLSRQMFMAAGGALSDSMARYLTWSNLLLLGMGFLIAACSPSIARRCCPIHPGGRRAVLLVIVIGMSFGFFLPRGSSQRNQNPVLFLARSFFPYLSSSTDKSLASAPVEFISPVRNELAELSGAARGKNLLVVVLESTGAKAAQPSGSSRRPMPFLDHLSREALVFDQAYCVYPESIKGLLSFLCSRPPALDHSSQELARWNTPSLAGLLQERGYRTGLFHSGRFDYLGMDSVVRNRGFEIVEDAGEIGGNRESSFGIDEDSAVKRILNWIDHQSRPFFALYLPIAGHHPYESPAPWPFPGATEADHHRNALHYSDRSLALLWEGLRQRGLADQTLLAVFGDHGEAFGEHSGNFGHTLQIYEENIRVPFLIRVPGDLNQRSGPGLASLLDVTPTLLDLLGVASSPAFQGRSLLQHQRRYLFFYTDYASPLVGCREGEWKLIHDLLSGDLRLFNLTADPEEKENLANRWTQKTDSLKSLALDWARAQKNLLKGELKESPAESDRVASAHFPRRLPTR